MIKRIKRKWQKSNNNKKFNKNNNKSQPTIKNLKMIRKPPKTKVRLKPKLKRYNKNKNHNHNLMIQMHL